MEVQQRGHIAGANKPQGGTSGKKRISLNIGEIPFQANEAINVLRGNIQMSGCDLKTIAVTSALAHEGKSSIAFRLARSLANLEKKTLYLDCDIRNSKTKKRYGIVEKTEGLSEFLCGQLPMEKMIFQTDDPCLDMIFSGKYAPNPSELLSGELFHHLMQTLKSSYDYVIVDTPPANLVIDAILVAKECDSTIIVVESGYTDRREVLRLKGILDNAEIKVLGVVLNKIMFSKKHYGYGRYGYKKYGYGRQGYGYEDYMKEQEENGKDE